MELISVITEQDNGDLYQASTEQSHISERLLEDFEPILSHYSSYPIESYTIIQYRIHNQTLVS
jgi:hypothetical protein